MTGTTRSLPGALIASACLLLLAATAHGEITAITGVDVIPMDGERVLRAQVVLVDDDRIAAVGADLTIPEDARRIDGTGRFLIPGLNELHAHVPNSEAGLDRVLTLFLANGVTTIRGMLGAPSHLKLRADLASGERLGPRLITSGPSLNGNSVSGTERARDMVARQARAGYDFLKLHPGLSRAEFDAIVEAAREADLPFAGHVSVDVGLERALDAGQDCIDHLDGYMQALVRDDVDLAGQPAGFFGVRLARLVDDEKIAQLARRTFEAGTWNVATQTLIENIAAPVTGAELAAREHMRYMPADTVAGWKQSKDGFLANAAYDADVAQRAVDVRRRLIKALHDEGAGLLLGSDAPQVFNVPGFATHEELALLVAAGLTPYEALRTGTVNPAEYFGETGARGTIAPGAAADLVLLRANPLDDIAHTQAIDGVMIGGRWLDRGALDALLARFDTRD